MSDPDLVLAKFRENADREDLSVYDQARGAKELLEMGFSGDRKRMREAVNRSNEWISHQLVIAGIPDEVMVVYPLLHEASYNDLVELGGLCRASGAAERLLVERDNIRSDSAAALVRRLCRLLAQSSDNMSSAKADPVIEVLDEQGRRLSECKTLRKGIKTLRFDSSQSAFVDYLIKHMPRLYSEFAGSK